MRAFGLLESWPVNNVAAAAIGPDGAVHRVGDQSRVFALASITKLFTAAAVHLAVEEGSVLLSDVPDATTSRGATIADLLAHGGGLAPNGDVLDDPGQRRIYSNGAYDLVASVVERSTEMAFADYLAEGVFTPLAMATAALSGSPAYGARASVDDLVAFTTGLPKLLAPATLFQMTNPHLPDLDGVLPGYGRQTPNVWGLGPEIRSTKSPHWTGALNSPETWGHFGQAGTFLWVDPTRNTSLIALTDQPFGEWALPLWPAFSDAVCKELSEPTVA